MGLVVVVQCCLPCRIPDKAVTDLINSGPCAEQSTPEELPMLHMNAVPFYVMVIVVMFLGAQWNWWVPQ
jgi:hypothetical protein